MIEIYGHPFAAFTWKATVAAYARDVPFTLRVVAPEEPDHTARMAELSPTGQFPALVAGAREVTGSNAVIASLDTVGDAPPLIPAGDPGLRARELADVMDDYVAVPMQRVVAECFRGAGNEDSFGVEQARSALRRTYRWLEPRVGSDWLAGTSFTIADCAAAPALFYADWVEPIPDGALGAYRARLLAHSSVARTVDAARPYRHFFPLGAPDRD